MDNNQTTNNNLQDENSNSVQNPPNSVNRFFSTPAVHLVAYVLALFLSVVGGIMFIRLANDVYHHYHSTNLTKTTATSSLPFIDSITKSGFSPSTIIIHKGQAVVWTNYDNSSHIIASDPYPTDNALPGLKSNTLLQGSSYSYIFNQKGIFNFHDDLNPSNFKGEVIVQ